MERLLRSPVIRIFLSCRKAIAASPADAGRRNYSLSFSRLMPRGDDASAAITLHFMTMKANFRRLCALLLPVIIAACGDSPWNNPYPAADSGKNILYSSFNERPKHLDPVQSYSTNESTFTAQIYEPPLQYHYLKRPYTLVSCVAEEMPKPRYLDASGRELPASAPAKDIASTVYEIKIKRGIKYQPHPAFARNVAGEPVYQNLGDAELAGKNVLADF